MDMSMADRPVPSQDQLLPEASLEGFKRRSELVHQLRVVHKIQNLEKTGVDFLTHGRC